MAFDVITVGIVCADVMVRPVDELPPRGHLGLAPQLEMHLGGLAGVTACVCSQLGGKTAFVGLLGQDSFGDFLLHTLQSNGVNTEEVRRTDELCSSATVVLISKDGERTFLHHVGVNAATTEAQLDFDFLTQAKVLHWGGPVVTPQLDGPPMGRVFEAIRERGCKTAIDTCFDGEGKWLSRIEPALPHTNIIFSSLEEARYYTGQHDPEDIADFYRAYGVEIAVIKLGHDGIFVKSATEKFHLPAYTVDVVDTTGAGDAACGAFLYGYTHNWDIPKCAHLANAVGALTVQHMGGAESIRSLEETMQFMERGTC